jgi:hypothetical protein
MITQPEHGFDHEVLPSALVLIQPEGASIEPRIGTQVSGCDIRMFHEVPTHQIAVVADASGLAVPRDQQQASGLDRPRSEDERPCVDAESVARQRRTVRPAHAPSPVGELHGGGVEQEVDVFGSREVFLVSVESAVLTKLEDHGLDALRIQG